MRGGSLLGQLWLMTARKLHTQALEVVAIFKGIYFPWDLYILLLMNFGTRRCLLCVCHNDTLDIFALGLLCCTLHSLRGVFKMNMEVAIKS